LSPHYPDNHKKMEITQEEIKDLKEKGILTDHMVKVIQKAKLERLK